MLSRPIAADTSLIERFDPFVKWVKSSKAIFLVPCGEGDEPKLQFERVLSEVKVLGDVVGNTLRTARRTAAPFHDGEINQNSGHKPIGPRAAGSLSIALKGNLQSHRRARKRDDPVSDPPRQPPPPGGQRGLLKHATDHAAREVRLRGS